jgi:creatinine amidohydrolase
MNERTGTDRKDAAMREWVLSENTHAFVRSQEWQVAVLPCGATEPHNLHMPYGTDCYEAAAIGERACEKAYTRGAKVLLLPTIPFGVNTNYFHVPGSLACSLNPTTLYALVGDIVDAMERRGVRKIMLLNCHGGNELKPVLRELHHRSKAFVSLCDFWRTAPDKEREIFNDPGEHAGELETSLGLAFFPQFMAKLESADAGVVAKPKLEALQKGWVQITRPWHLATTSTGAGDPSQATAEKGRAYLELITDRIGDYLYDLAQASLDEKFPY